MLHTILTKLPVSENVKVLLGSVEVGVGAGDPKVVSPNFLRSEAGVGSR